MSFAKMAQFGAVGVLFAGFFVVTRGIRADTTRHESNRVVTERGDPPFWYTGEHARVFTRLIHIEHGFRLKYVFFGLAGTGSTDALF